MKLKLKINNYYTQNINQWHFFSATKFNVTKTKICWSAQAHGVRIDPGRTQAS